MLKPNTYRVLEMAVEEGVAYGYRRVFKYNDAPTEDDIKRVVTDAVMNSICEWFDFEDIDHEGN